jgi:hypothetical protein
MAVGFSALLTATALPAQGQSVVISEFLASNHRGLLYGDVKSSDWI